MELISIIVPVYNVEKYLSQCIESLINQTYTNIEIILVDDGSTDCSGIICDKLKKKDKRINVIHKDNEGLGLARNTGLNYVNGKYVTFIDSDDYADEDLIYNLYHNISKNDADTCIGGFKRVDDLGKALYIERYENKSYKKSDCRKIVLARMLGSCPEKSDSIRMSVWNVLYSVDIIQKNNIKFPSERVYISEDIIFDIEYYKHSQKCVLINTCSYNYRVNQQSLTQLYKKDKFEKYLFLYNEILKKLQRDNFGNEFIVRLQRQFFVNVRVCLRQEDTRISGNSIREAIRNIKAICKNDILQEIISEYPIYKLPWKQKLFLYLVNHKLVCIIFIFIKMNLI